MVVPARKKKLLHIFNRVMQGLHCQLLNGIHPTIPGTFQEEIIAKKIQVTNTTNETTKMWQDTKIVRKVKEKKKLFHTKQSSIS